MRLPNICGRLFLVLPGEFLEALDDALIEHIASRFVLRTEGGVDRLAGQFRHIILVYLLGAFARRHQRAHAGFLQQVRPRRRIDRGSAGREGRIAGDQRAHDVTTVAAIAPRGRDGEKSQMGAGRDLVCFAKEAEGLLESFESGVELLQQMGDADPLHDVVKLGGLSRLVDVNRQHGRISSHQLSHRARQRNTAALNG